MKITLVKDIDSQALYVDGELQAEGTIITARDVLEVIKEYGVHTQIMEVDDVWFSNHGFNYPQDISDLKISKEINN